MPKILAQKAYDPASAVNKVTTALLAMTALDTTNLRNTFTVPSNGIVMVRMVGALHGAATYPQILLGVLEGSTVKGRMPPEGLLNGAAAATQILTVQTVFTVGGLTPAASLSWDAAYGVETVVASTGLKYGGPNNTTGNDAFGAFLFEVWSTD